MTDRIRVLLIDDETVFVDNLAGILTRRGMKVQSINDGLKALDLLTNESYDVLVLDLRMPGMDGLELQRRLNDSKLDLPVMQGFIMVGGVITLGIYLLLDGWAFRHQSLEDGRRQILDFALPGAVVGFLQAAVGLGHADLRVELADGGKPRLYHDRRRPSTALTPAARPRSPPGDSSARSPRNSRRGSRESPR